MNVTEEQLQKLIVNREACSSEKSINSSKIYYPMNEYFPFPSPSFPFPFPFPSIYIIYPYIYSPN